MAVYRCCSFDLYMSGSTLAGSLCRRQMFCRYPVSDHLRGFSLPSPFHRPLTDSETESKPYRSLSTERDHRHVFMGRCPVGLFPCVLLDSEYLMMLDVGLLMQPHPS